MKGRKSEPFKHKYPKKPCEKGKKDNEKNKNDEKEL